MHAEGADMLLLPAPACHGSEHTLPLDTLHFILIPSPPPPAPFFFFLLLFSLNLKEVILNESRLSGPCIWKNINYCQRTIVFVVGVW